MMRLIKPSCASDIVARRPTVLFSNSAKVPFHFPHQITELDPERLGDFLHVHDGNVSFATLHIANVGTIEARQGSQPFL